MAVRLDHGADDLAEVHEINLTPFIDVMLVLLIFFMVAAPLTTVDVEVDLTVSTAERPPLPEVPGEMIDLVVPVAFSLHRQRATPNQPGRIVSACAGLPGG